MKKSGLEGAGGILTQAPSGPAGPPSRHSEGRAETENRLAIALFLFLNFFFVLTSTGRVRTYDEVLASMQTESIVLHGTTAVPQALGAGVTYVRQDRQGKIRAPYPPAPAIAAIPWFLVGHYFIARLPGVPVRVRVAVGDFSVVLSNATWAALTAALAFLLFCRLGISVRTSLWATILLALATPLFAYSAWFYSEPLASLLLMGAAYCLFGLRREESIPLWRAAIAGILLGALLWVRTSHFVAVPVFLLGILVRGRSEGWRTAIVTGALAAAAGVAFLLRDAVLFGNAFDLGYPETAEHGKHLNTFQTPFWVGLEGFLISPGKSLFMFAPPILLALAGLRRLWHRDSGLALVTAFTPVVYLLFFMTYTQWEGGYCYGPRYLVPAIPLLCLGLGPALQGATARLRQLAVILFVLGFAVQAIGLATSFFQFDMIGGYYDAQDNYVLTNNAIAGQARLLWHYLRDLRPAPIGLGFDRWFVFLYKAGVSEKVLWTIGLLAFAGAIVSAWRIIQALCSQARS